MDFDIFHAFKLLLTEVWIDLGLAPGAVKLRSCPKRLMSKLLGVWTLRRLSNRPQSD